MWVWKKCFHFFFRFFAWNLIILPKNVYFGTYYIVSLTAKLISVIRLWTTTGKLNCKTIWYSNIKTTKNNQISRDFCTLFGQYRVWDLYLFYVKTIFPDLVMVSDSEFRISLCTSILPPPPPPKKKKKKKKLEYLTSPPQTPVRTPGFNRNTSSVSPACRKRRLKGRR